MTTCRHGYKPERCPDCAALRIASHTTIDFGPIPATGFLSAIALTVRPTGGWPQPEPEHEWGELPDDMEPEDHSEPEDTADEFEDEPFRHGGWMNTFSEFDPNTGERL